MKSRHGRRSRKSGSARRGRRACGGFVAACGLLLSLEGAATLVQGFPTYLNVYRLPVSAHVAVSLGIGLVVAGLWFVLRPPKRLGLSVPPSWRARSPVPNSAADSPGRNEPCPCGSGRKYKHCCRSRDEARRRRADRHRRSAALNHSHEVTGGTSMANRGLRGR
jgi:hypothetical protein